MILLQWLAGAGLFAAGAACGAVNLFWAALGTALLTPCDTALAFGSVTVYTTEAWLAGLAAGWAWQAFRQPAALRAAWRRAWPALPMLAAVLLSLTAATSAAAGGKQFLRWAEFFLVAALAADGVRSREQADRLLTVLLGLGAVLSALGVVQCLLGLRLAANAVHAAAGFEAMQGLTAVRAYATFGHPNQFAGYLILLLPLACGEFLEPAGRLRTWLSGGACLLLGSALALTYSRAGWLSAGAALLLVLAGYFPRAPRKTLAVALAGMAAGAVLFLATPTLQSRLSGVGRASQDAAVTGRLGYQKMALAMIRERPWLGHGAGNYQYILAKYLAGNPGGRKYLDAHIHNWYSQIAIETGVAGLAAFWFFLAYALWRLVRALRRLPADADRTRLFALLAAVCAFLLHNNFDVLWVYARGVHFALILGLGLAWADIAGREQAAGAGGRLW